MIYIWDNGEAYSSHEVYFIDCNVDDWACVVTLLSAESFDGEAHLLAQSEELDWRSGGPCAIYDVLSRDTFVYGGKVFDPPKFDLLTPSVARQLLIGWKKTEDEFIKERAAHWGPETISGYQANVDANLQCFQAECVRRGLL